MLELDDEQTGYGHGACISRGTYVGAQNVTFIVRQDDSTGYGRQVHDELMKRRVCCHIWFIDWSIIFKICHNLSPNRSWKTPASKFVMDNYKIGMVQTHAGEFNEVLNVSLRNNAP